MRRAIFLSFVYLSAASISSAATPYETAVKNLQPSYYYQLNEPDHTGGVIDSMGNAEPGSYNGDYENGLPQAGCPGPLFVNEGQDGGDVFEYEEIAVPGVGGEANLAHCSNNEGHIILGPSENYGAGDITVALFFKADFAQGGDRLFTNNLADPDVSFQVNVANEGLVVAVDPNQSGEFAERTLWTKDDSEPDRALIRAEYGWFHVVASTSGPADERADNIQVWVNGENRTENLFITNWGWGINTDQAKIGGRHEDPLATTTHSGAQDEVAIWLDRVLTEEEVQSLWQAALSDTPTNPFDFDGDGSLGLGDLNLLLAQIAAGGNNLTFDVTGDGAVNNSDIKEYVNGQDKLNTYIGDANLDGEFNTSDLVQIFQEGKFEKDQLATWNQGDWNGDARFNTTDLVAAFQDGGFEKGPRVAAAAVPEPSAGVCLMIAIGMLVSVGRRINRTKN